MVSEVSILIPVYNLLKDWNLLNTFVGMAIDWRKRKPIHGN